MHLLFNFSQKYIGIDTDKVKVKLLSPVSLWDSMDCSLPGSSVHGIFQSKSTGVGCHFLLQGIFLTQLSNPGSGLWKWKWSRSVVSDSFATPWAVAYQASLSMRFSRQKYWNGLPFPSPGVLLDPGINPRSSALEADALTSEPPGNPITSCRQRLLPSEPPGKSLVVSISRASLEAHW